jgi:flagellar hook-basal body complex protein FliE
VADLRIDTPQMIALPKPGLRPDQTSEGPGGGFARALGDALRQADGVQKTAEHEARELAAGRGDALAAVMALTKADLSLRFVTGVRNRALEAFNEIIRMPV